MLFVTSVLAAALVTSGAGGSGSGVTGRVVKGPIRPICTSELPCNGPAKGARVTFRRANVVRSTLTGANGRYRIALLPGRYRVTLTVGGLRPPAARTVIVLGGRYAVANFTIDTGIR
jgi:carboxypeptidase family protein